MARIRRVNVWVAGLILAVSAAWMTPLLDAERIATQSQVARYLDGRTPLHQTALWEMAHDWGRAGQAGLEQLVAQQNDQNAELEAAILAAQDAQSKRSYQRRDYDGTRLGLAQELLDLMTVVPADKAVTAKMLSGFPEHRMEDWSSLCRSRAIPGCVLVLADFGPNQPDVAGLFLVPSHNEKFDAFSVLNMGSKLVIGTVLGDRFQTRLTEAEIWKLLNGDYEIAPSSTNSMWIGETELLPTR